MISTLYGYDRVDSAADGLLISEGVDIIDYWEDNTLRD
jgi:hypothetical protein